MRIVFARLMAAIMLAGVLMPCLPLTAHSAQVTGGVTLKDADSGQLLPFHASNLFPGDSVTEEYQVTAVHKEPVALQFRSDIRPDEDYQKLAEVLQIQVLLPEKGVTLYDGLMKDMPNALSHTLAADEHSITYRITVSLDPSVGNAYQNRELIADFRWWYLDEESRVPVTLTAEKTLDQQYARGSQFAFELKDAAGQVVSRVNNEDGHIQFGTLYFTAPGIYAYTITEVTGTDSQITYDPAVYRASISVSQDGTVSVSYTRNGGAYSGLPRFTNASKGQTLPDDPSQVRPENPKTSDTFPVHILAVICLGSLSSLICLFLLWKDRKKEGTP